MKSKKLKSHIAQIFVALGGFSAVAESCDSRLLLPVGESDFAKDELDGLQLLPLSVYFPKNAKLNCIANFARDIVSDPSLKIRFHENPDNVLNEYGLHEVDKNSFQIQFILANSDPEIQSAICANDFKLYLKLLKERNLLQSDLISEILQLLEQQPSIIDLCKGTPVSPLAGDKIDSIVLAIPVAIAVAVAIFVVAACSVAAAMHVATSMDVCVDGENISPRSLIEDDAIDLFVDKNHNLNTKEISEEEHIRAIREVFETIFGNSNSENINNLYQIACGTTKKLITDRNVNNEE